MIIYTIILNVPVDDADAEAINAVDQIVAAEIRAFKAVASLVAQHQPSARAKRKGAFGDAVPLDLAALDLAADADAVPASTVLADG